MNSVTQNIHEILTTMILLLGIVALALYISKELGQRFSKATAAKAIAATEEYEKTVDELSQEVAPKIELWWMETGKALVDRRIDTHGNPFIPRGFPIPEEAKAALSEPFYDAVKHAAIHLATHLITEKDFLLTCSTLKRVDAGAGAEFESKVLEHIDEHRKLLEDCGVDLDAFEKDFALT